MTATSTGDLIERLRQGRTTAQDFADLAAALTRGDVVASGAAPASPDGVVTDPTSVAPLNTVILMVAPVLPLLDEARTTTCRIST